MLAQKLVLSDSRLKNVSNKEGVALRDDMETRGLSNTDVVCSFGMH